MGDEADMNMHTCYVSPCPCTLAAAGSLEGVGYGRAWRGELKAGTEASVLWLTTALLYHGASSRDD